METDSYVKLQFSRCFFSLIIIVFVISMALFAQAVQADDPTFTDVPFDHPYHDHIEALYQEGYVAGCSSDPLMYCPDQVMNRAESTVFVERGVHGAETLPSQPTEQIFADVPLNEWFAKWSAALWDDGYTEGCGTDPLIYCPLQEHTRTEGCVFFLRMMHGVDYMPPDPQGIFKDISLDWWGAKWVEAAYNAGLIRACGTDPELKFCPEQGLTRAIAAYMMVQAKEVPLPTPTPTTTPGPISGALIVDHHAAQAFDQIPDEWLESAREMTMHYAHTSHGSQIMSGLQALAAKDPKYSMTDITAGSSPPSALNCSPGSLCIYDGNPPETYITPEDYWSTEAGKDHTRDVANTGLFDFSMWAWCGQQSSNTEQTVQQYLDTMDGFEQEYPFMRQDKIIFDFADIERYDPAGNYYPNADDACDWCTDWCNTHPEDCQDLPSSCAHSHPLQCKLKAQAFWWMMARLAGWDGNPTP